MASISRFEDLIAWQKARMLTRDIYTATRTGMFSRDWGLVSQIQRATVSVMSNIAKGFERNRPTEFHQFLSVSKASCGEVRSQLYVAFDVGYLSPETFDDLMTKVDEVERIVGGLRGSVQRQCRQRS